MSHEFWDAVFGALANASPVLSLFLFLFENICNDNSNLSLSLSGDAPLLPLVVLRARVVVPNSLRALVHLETARMFGLRLVEGSVACKKLSRRSLGNCLLEGSTASVRHRTTQTHHENVETFASKHQVLLVRGTHPMKGNEGIRISKR